MAYAEHCESTYLDRANIRVLCSVFILIESIFCQFAFLKFHTELNELHHYRFERGNGAVSGPFRGNMFVQNSESSWRLLDSDEFLCSLVSTICQPSIISSTAWTTGRARKDLP